jgi:hypothetical protein
MTDHDGWTLSVLDELPGAPGVRHVHIPPGRAAGQDGLTVRVARGDERWLGTFAFGDLAPLRCATAARFLPGSTRLCVVARGAAYLVAAEDPGSWEALPVIPVRQVLSVDALGLVLLIGDVDISAYGATGLRWCTRRLALDSLTITTVEAGTLRGTYHDPRSEEDAAFEVDLATGDSRGGLEDP